MVWDSKKRHVTTGCTYRLAISTQEKIDYYTEHSKWLIGLPSDSFPYVKFYDEAQINLLKFN
jgi:hypothetical protein